MIVSENFEKEQNLQKIFIDFTILLNERFSQIGKKLDSISEDTIRFLFCHACTQNGIKPNKITLEEKGNFDCAGSEELELDMHIEENAIIPSIAAEFKYHRQEGSTQAKFDWAGNLIRDFNRLKKSKCSEKRLSVYVASPQMQDVYKKRKDWGSFMNELMSFPEGEKRKFSLPSKASTTFREKTKLDKNSTEYFTETDIVCRFSKELASGNNGEEKFALRIFEILN